jgi:hypothetical protein
MTTAERMGRPVRGRVDSMWKWLAPRGWVFWKNTRTVAVQHLASAEISPSHVAENLRKLAGLSRDR